MSKNFVNYSETKASPSGRSEGFMNLSLEGKYAIICGSTQGIGFSIAEELALLGANCTLMARNEETLKTVIHNLDIALRQQHNYLVADFTKPDDVKKDNRSTRKRS